MHSSLVYPLSFLFSFEVSDYRSRVLSQYAWCRSVLELTSQSRRIRLDPAQN